MGHFRRGKDAMLVFMTDDGRRLSNKDDSVGEESERRLFAGLATRSAVETRPAPTPVLSLLVSAHLHTGTVSPCPG
jgi:hypothetical protein